MKHEVFYILLFHKISTFQQELQNDFYAIHRDYLIKIINFVDKILGLKSIITISEALKNPTKFAISFSFDDGFESDYTIVAPLFLERNIKGTFFITTGFLGKNNYLKVSQVKKMYKMGIEIGSHSKTHPILTSLNKHKLKEELLDSKKYLEDIIGDEVEGFSIPGGFYNQRVLEMAFEAGYKYVCTSEPIKNLVSLPPSNKSLVLGRICIHQQLGLKKLEKILEGDKKILSLMKFQYHFKNILKKFLGIEKYIRLRKTLYGN